MKLDWEGWRNAGTFGSRKFKCGFCGEKVASVVGYHTQQTGAARIYICPECGLPTFFYDLSQFPGPLIGRNVEKLPDDVESLYREIRESIKTSAFTGAVLLARKLIMHLAVDVAGAKEGKDFVEYVDHLKSAGYVPPNGEQWLDSVRKIGNQKNHEVKIGDEEEAARLLKFIEVLLIFMYEFAGNDEGSDGG